MIKVVCSGLYFLKDYSGYFEEKSGQNWKLLQWSRHGMIVVSTRIQQNRWQDIIDFEIYFYGSTSRACSGCRGKMHN